MKTGNPVILKVENVRCNDCNRDIVGIDQCKCPKGSELTAILFFPELEKYFFLDGSVKPTKIIKIIVGHDQNGKC